MEATGLFLTAQKVSTCLLLCYVADMPASKEEEALSAYLMKEVTAMRASARTQCTWREMREELVNALNGKSMSSVLGSGEGLRKSGTGGGVRSGWRAVTWLEEQLIAINSPNELFVLFEEMQSIQKEHFSDQATLSSIFGSFLEETTLTFESLFFDGVSRLFLSMQEWAPRREGEIRQRKSLLDTHKNESLSEGQQEEEEEEEEEYSDRYVEKWEEMEKREYPTLVRLRSLGSSTPHGLLSAAEVELFVAQEAEHIHSLLLIRSREGMGREESERVTERDISERIEGLRRMAPKVSAVHYLALVFELQRRNVSRARDELHRYFDHQVYEHAIRKREKEGTGKEGQKRSSLLPFALLNLASLHFLFSDFDEGVQAVSEAIRLAQANSDQGVLTVGLTWLHRLLQQQMSTSKASPSSSRSLFQVPLSGKVAVSPPSSRGEGREGATVSHAEGFSLSGAVSGGTSALATTKFFTALLERCVAMGERESLPYLSSLNSLALSELLLHRSTAVVPVAETSDLPLFSHGDSTSGLLWQVLDLSDRENAQNALRSLAAKGQLLRSSCWADFGHSDLSRLYAVIPLLSCAPPHSDIAKQKDAGGVLLSSSSSSSFSSSSSDDHRESLSQLEPVRFVEEFCGACCKLAYQLAEEGKVRDAFLTLSQLESLVPTHSLPREQALAVTLSWLRIRVKESLYKGETFKAVLLLEEAAALDPSHPSTLLELEVARAAHRLPAALSIANRALAQIGRAFDARQQRRQVPLLLWKARTHRECGQSALALQSALKALSLCHEAQLFTMKAAACLELAAAHLALQCPSRAVAIVQALLPQILRHSPLLVRGEAQLLLARALASRATVDRCSPAAQKRTFTAALAQLSRAIGCFEELEMLSNLEEAYHLTALLHCALGDECERDKAAVAFVTLRQRRKVMDSAAATPGALLPGGIRHHSR